METTIKKSNNFKVMISIFVGLVILTIISLVSGGIMLRSFVFWGWMIYLFLHASSKCWINEMNLTDSSKTIKSVILVALITVSVLCIVPMGFIPCFNGEIPDHRNQYELLAESILNGHLYIEYAVDPHLLEMENPYDPAMREQSGVEYHWDHAFYNGHYYMYFGIVPVLVLFLPYRLITGLPLTTYHATQVFTIFFIMGLFSITYGLTVRRNKKMTLGCYLFVTSALCIVSVNNIIEAPALYNTAVSSGICFSVWSIYFYLKAFNFFMKDEIDPKCLVTAALFGALVFGCRPNIGLYNIIVIPAFYWIYLKLKNETGKMILTMMYVILPYLIIGLLLMLYNYVRFDSVFEFGQSYQLTIADQHSYMQFSQLFNISKIADGYMTIFLGYYGLQNYFPYVSYNGILICYPVLWLFAPMIIIGWSERRTYNRKAYQFALTILISVLFIVLSTIVMSPIPTLERYKGDEYFLIGIVMYMILLEFTERSEKTSRIMIFLSVLTYLVAFLLYFAGESYIQFYFPNSIEFCSKIIWPF